MCVYTGDRFLKEAKDSLHYDNMVRTNNLIVGLDKFGHMQQQQQQQPEQQHQEPLQQSQQHQQLSPLLIKPASQPGRGTGHTQFRDPKSAPLRKLSVDLIATYKFINQVKC